MKNLSRKVAKAQKEAREMFKEVDEAFAEVGIERGKDVFALPMLHRGRKEIWITPKRGLSRTERQKILYEFIGLRGWTTKIGENK